MSSLVRGMRPDDREKKTHIGLLTAQWKHDSDACTMTPAQQHPPVHTDSVRDELVVQHRRVGVDLDPVDRCKRGNKKKKTHTRCVSVRTTIHTHVWAQRKPPRGQFTSPMVATSDMNTRRMEFATLNGEKRGTFDRREVVKRTRDPSC